MMLAWGKKVSREFRDKVRSIAARLCIEPDWLMACMAFESGESFDPSIRNAAGSGAVGLIQFMPGTAAALGTCVLELGEMSAEKQLDYVARYFAPRTGRLHNLGDVYMAILWPGGIGKDDAFVLFNKDDVNHPKLYLQNAGLDADHDGHVTRGETCAKIYAKLERGLLPENIAVD